MNLFKFFIPNTLSNKRQTALALMVGLLCMSSVDAFAEPVIDDRQQAFQRIGALGKQSEAWLEQSVIPWDAFEQSSAELVAQVAILNRSFPLGSHEGSKSKEAIRQKPESFQQLMDEMAEGIELIHEASVKQDAGLAEKGLDQMNGTCRACHRSYRSRW